MVVAVTGGLGGSGRYLIPELNDAGHEPICIDTPMRASVDARYRQANLEDLGEALHALRGADAVVHLARASSASSPERLFRGNVMQTWNVLQAAEALARQPSGVRAGNGCGW